MRKEWLIIAMGVASCRQIVEATPPDRPTAYLIIASTSPEQGWRVLDDLDRTLPIEDRRRIEVRGLVSGSGNRVMVRFFGDCVSDAAFVTHVRAVAVAHHVLHTRCAATLPAG